MTLADPRPRPSLVPAIALALLLVPLATPVAAQDATEPSAAKQGDPMPATDAPASGDAAAEPSPASDGGSPGPEPSEGTEASAQETADAANGVAQTTAAAADASLDGIVLAPTPGPAPEAPGPAPIVSAPAPVAPAPATPVRVLVGLDPGTMAGLDALASFPMLRAVPAIGLVGVEAPSVEAVASALAGVPGVRYVEADGLRTSFATPSDPRYGGQYGPAIMGFGTAWDGTAGYGSSVIKVAVIDSGLYRTHPDFTPASRFLSGYDYIQDDTTPQDACGHGTHVTGTVAATTNNAIGVAGMSQATIIPYRVLTSDILGRCSGSNLDIAAAIVAAADAGARIISMSLGGPSSDSATASAVTYAWGKGAVIVAAAGNDGAETVNYPAAYPESIAVSAVTSTKALASYSSYGSKVEIAGPGSNVDSTSSSGSYTTMSGTSMATPHVSGALALALSCAPTTTNSALRTALQETAQDLGTAGRDKSFGYGLARADLLVDRLCGSTPPPNRPPVAAATATPTGLTVAFSAAGTVDPDGDALTYAWTFGDGGTGTGVAPSRTYAAYGTYTATVTANDGRGGTDSESVTFTLSSDPDPATPTLENGVAVTVSLAGSGDEKHFKILVPAGKSQLKVEQTGPACGLLSCSFDADLYVRRAARATDTAYDCRPFVSGSTETCTIASPASGYWYVRADAYTGSGSVTLKATYT